jgi:hypothetical protein
MVKTLAICAACLSLSAVGMTIPRLQAPSKVGPAAIYPRTEVGAPNPNITQDNIDQNICSKGWSTDEVRPSTSVTTPIKREKMKEYGYSDTGLHYELDHLVSLQVGGCPACKDNL